MALQGKQDIKSEIKRVLPFEGPERTALMNVLGVADRAEEGDLEEMQQLLRMIADADYEQPDIL